MSRNVHGRFPGKNPVPKILGKLGPKSDVFGFFSKSAPRIYFDIQDVIRGHYWAHFAENRMSGKNLVPELWARKGVKTVK